MRKANLSFFFALSFGSTRPDLKGSVHSRVKQESRSESRAVAPGNGVAFSISQVPASLNEIADARIVRKCRSQLLPDCQGNRPFAVQAQQGQNIQCRGRQIPVGWKRVSDGLCHRKTMCLPFRPKTQEFNAMRSQLNTNPPYYRQSTS